MFDVLRVQENPALFFPLAAGLAAVETRGGANAARGEKPRLGLPSIRTASHLGFAVCNSTTALGLRAGWVENRGGTYRWARYYNSLTGRFLSRDPEAGKPIDPKTLHKYLYAGGDPVNAKDPSGRDAGVETALILTTIVTRTIPAVVQFACALEIIYGFEAELVNYVTHDLAGWVSKDPLPPPPHLLNLICAYPGVKELFF
jgi:RHS repeat-associated protein